MTQWRWIARPNLTMRHVIRADSSGDLRFTACRRSIRVTGYNGWSNREPPERICSTCAAVYDAA